jgi:hypothetical protein
MKDDFAASTGALSPAVEQAQCHRAALLKIAMITTVNT